MPETTAIDNTKSATPTRPNVVYAGRIYGAGNLAHRVIVCQFPDRPGTPDSILGQRRDIRSYPDALDWGNQSGGAAQVALAILAHHFNSTTHDTRQADREAESWHQRFKTEVVAAFPRGEGFTLTSADVELWLQVTREELEHRQREAFDARLADRWE
jgi:hypothetical protein